MIFLGFSARAQGQQGIQGLWLNHKENVIIEIYEEEGAFYGKIHEIIHFPEDEVKGYSPAELESGKQKMKGRHILTGLTYKNEQWVNGQVHDPRDNQVQAHCTAHLSPNHNRLNIQFKKGLLSTTKVWTRYTLAFDARDK